MSVLDPFWDWYERHYALNVGIAALLFTLQLVHLFWLTTDVVAFRLLGYSLYDPSPWFQSLLAVVDYTEIPAIITTSVVYINELRKGFNWKDFSYLAFINIQLIHIFWITHEFVTSLVNSSMLPAYAVWFAILIDYLELPVIYETVRKFINAYRSGNVKEFLEEDLE